MKATIAQPFIKWAGGKRQLLNELEKYYPQTIERYIEPFVGGGAVLFDIIAKRNPKEIIINDACEPLIIAYKMICKKPNQVIDILSRLQKRYHYAKTMDELKGCKTNTKEYYNKIRNEYNFGNIDDITRAAYFIFLNRTCFNGLYRTNQNGQFNVPAGDQKRPIICDVKNIKAISKTLKPITIVSGDYKDCINKYLTPDAFVYLDPPYRPLTKTASFTAYTTYIWDDNKQMELAKTIEQIANCGAKFLLSNSDPHNNDPNDNFFDDLYKNFTIERICANRVISSKNKGRKKVTELLIHN